MQDILAVAAGLFLLAAGGELLVRGAVSVARRLNVSELLIGLVLVGFGTSTPELVTSLQAALSGSPGIAVGNVVGSNISNILLILGVVALVRPIPINAAAMRRDRAVMVGAAVALVAIGTLLGQIDRLFGAILLLGLAAYLVVAWRGERKGGPAAEHHEAEAKTHDPPPQALWLALGLSAVGLVMLIFGAGALVGGAVRIASAAGVSETVIGLTMVAVGTSLPELMVSLVAAVRGRSDVAVGNIVGSNIYNILGILGLTALITPVAMPEDLLARDWAALLLATLALAVWCVLGWRVSRPAGVALLAGYGLYCWLLLQPGAVQG